MSLKLGDQLSIFPCATPHGNKENFRKLLDLSLGILFSHPVGFTPVCTTELAKAVDLAPEFEKRDVKMTALSIDDEESHKKWCHDIITYRKHVGTFENYKEESIFSFPIITDVNRELVTNLRMSDPEKISPNRMELTTTQKVVIPVD